MAYLSLTEEATYIDVEMNGVDARFWFNRTPNQSTDTIEFFDSTPTELGKSRGLIPLASNMHVWNTGNSMSIVKNTSDLIILQLTGEVRLQADGVAYTHSDGLVVDYYIYPDRIFVNWAWTVDGSFSLDAISDYSSLLGFHKTGVTSTAWYESAGNEVQDVGAATVERTGDYVLTKSTELNVQTILVSEDTSGLIGTYTQMLAAVSGASIHWDSNASLTAGTYSFRGVIILDAAERDGASQIYSESDRIDFGDAEWFDSTQEPAVQTLALAQPVSDLEISSNIAVGTQALVLAQPVPTVKIDATLAVGVQALVLAQYDVEVGTGTIVSAGLQTLALAQPVSTVQIDATFAVDVQAMALAQFAPAILISSTIAVGVQALTLTQYAAIVSTANPDSSIAKFYAIPISYGFTVNLNEYFVFTAHNIDYSFTAKPDMGPYNFTTILNRNFVINADNVTYNFTAYKKEYSFTARRR